jgi:hypothetical protein
MIFYFLFTSKIKMGRYYWGDIEGKFAFGIQCSYDPEEFGCDAIELYQWTCGCESELGEPPEDCCHSEAEVEAEVEVDSEAENDSENTNTQSDSPFKLKFNFCNSQLEYIKEKLDEILDSYPEEIKENFFNYMKSADYYCKEKLAEMYKVSESEITRYLELYYRYELGKEIYDYLSENETCTFFGEL